MCHHDNEHVVIESNPGQKSQVCWTSQPTRSLILNVNNCIWVNMIMLYPLDILVSSFSFEMKRFSPN